MKVSDYEPYRILGKDIKIAFYWNILQILFPGNRQGTVSRDRRWDTRKIVLNKVLSDERTAAYASDIADINRWWSDCKDCNWYKSEQTILSEARLSI